MALADDRVPRRLVAGTAIVTAVLLSACFVAVAAPPALGPYPRPPDPVLGLSAPRTADGGTLARALASTARLDPGPALGGPGRATPTLARPQTVVNPEKYYTAEPAPTGIADFGVTGKGSTASGYAYASSAFQGEAHVDSMALTISGSTSKVAAFELNEMLLVQRNGTNYSYWIQNGLHLDAASDQYSIGGAYVWNFSSPGARLSPGELQGAAGSTLLTDTYYYYPSCSASFAGQCSTLTLPATLTGRVQAGLTAGVPFVSYEYNLGAGWVTYDTVDFLGMNGSSSASFFVDGMETTPYSAAEYYDAEWVWVGAGGGSSGVDQGSEINLSLSYWNGHNYQAVPSAWNFGSNTGEKNSNVTSTVGSTVGGVPDVELTSGAGSLGVIYNATTVGFVNITGLTTSPETVRVDGVPIDFSGGWANLTLESGAHTVTLENYSNTTETFQVVAGRTTSVDFPGAGQLVFVENGLPAGTYWGVTLGGGTPSWTTSRTQYFTDLPNGTYSVAYATVAGYHLNGSPPRFVFLPGTSQVVLNFTQTTYQVTVGESGLPSSTTWWIVVNGTRSETSQSSLHLLLPNGTTTFEVGAPYTFLADPSNGTIDVSNGVAAPITIQFTYRPGTIEGVVSPAGATVTVDGVPTAVTEGWFEVEELPGTYSVAVSATGYLAQQTNVTASPGNTSWVNVTLSVAPSTQGPPSSTSGSGTGVPLLVAVALVAGAALVAVVAVVVVSLRRRQR